MKITVAMSLVLIAVVELLAPQLAALFTDDPSVRQAAVLNFGIEIVGQLFYAVLWFTTPWLSAPGIPPSPW